MTRHDNRILSCLTYRSTCRKGGRSGRKRGTIRPKAARCSATPRPSEALFAQEAVCRPKEPEAPRHRLPANTGPQAAGAKSLHPGRQRHARGGVSTSFCAAPTPQRGTRPADRQARWLRPHQRIRRPIEGAQGSQARGRHLPSARRGGRPWEAAFGGICPSGGRVSGPVLADRITGGPQPRDCWPCSPGPAATGIGRLRTRTADPLGAGPPHQQPGRDREDLVPTARRPRCDRE